MPVSNIKIRTSLPRRTMLRGAGAVALSLPMLEVMEPVHAAKANESNPQRFVAICASLGFHRPNLIPEKTGRDYQLTPYMEILKDHKHKCTVLSGVSHPAQQGANGHTSELTWLTSAQRPGLAGFRNTISIDQVIANQIGTQTRFPFMALSPSGRSMSWTSTGVEIPAMRSPEKIFKSMFVNGTEQEIKNEIKQLQRGRSIMDKVVGEAKKMNATLGQRDQHKLEEYFEAIRDLEKRLSQKQAWAKKTKPTAPGEALKDEKDKAKAIEIQELFYEVMYLAIVSDSTRTMTFQISGMNSAPDIPGVDTDWHNLSHHGKDPKKIEELTIIEKAEFVALNTFLTKLEKTKERGKSLLDHTSVLYGSNLGNASSHEWKNLPLVLAGGSYKHQGHIAGDPKNNTPFANLFVSLANRMGVEIDQFGSSKANKIDGLDYV